MYFKRWVIILTLGVYNLNIQNFSEWDHIFYILCFHGNQFNFFWISISKCIYKNIYMNTYCYDLENSHFPNSDTRASERSTTPINAYSGPILIICSWVPICTTLPYYVSESRTHPLYPFPSSLSHFLYKYCFTLPYLSFPASPSVMPINPILLTSVISGLLSDPSRLSLYVHNTFWTWIVLCSLLVQTSSYISRTTPVYFLREDVQIDNQPQNLKKYQMYFKRGVIILTLGVYNLNVQKFFECLQTF